MPPTGLGRPGYREGVKRSTPLRIVAIVLASLCLIAIVAVGTRISEGLLSTIVLGLSLGTGLWAIALSRRDRSRYEQFVREQVARESARAERLALATELHDVVSHGLGMITLRASTEPYLTRDTELRSALNDIESSARSAILKLRAILSLLRDDGPADAQPPPLELPELVAQGRAAGLEIVDATGDVQVSSPVARRVLAQVVQESLANTARHAGPTKVQVTIERQDDLVRAVVQDEGVAAGWTSLPGCGAGLKTMRERCEHMGGQLQIRAEPTGFTVIAELPDPRDPA